MAHAVAVVIDGTRIPTPDLIRVVESSAVPAGRACV
jgi:hypothetical protein